MKEKASKFKEGDVVKVLPDVKDPDFNTNIGGWTGIIEKIEFSENGERIYKVKWNNKTLSMAGDNYIDKCEDENLDYEIIFLAENELELFN